MQASGALLGDATARSDAPVMLLLTGATGASARGCCRCCSSAARTCAAWCASRAGCGERRVDVQIALGDLGELSTPTWCARRCAASTPSIHLAATIRDQPPKRIEELNGLATVRLLRAAERSGRRALRLLQRARRRRRPAHPVLPRQVAGRAGGRVLAAATTVFAPSIVYDRSDPWITLLRRFSFLPVLPVSGDGRAALPADLGRGRRPLRGRRAGRRQSGEPRYELAGPETLTYDEMSDLVSRIAGRPRPLVHVPLPLVRAGLDRARAPFSARPCSPPGRRPS